MKGTQYMLKDRIKESFKGDIGPDIGFGGWTGVDQVDKSQAKQIEQNV